MSVGTLHAKIVLDQPGKIHCGSRDPVSGHVNIRYQPGPQNPGAAELFGPLKVAVILHGRAKTKIWKSQGQSTRIYRGRAPLFRKTLLIYDDSFRAQPGDSVVIPFSICFPETTAGGGGLHRDGFEEDVRFIGGHVIQPLPPSFQNSYHGFAHRYEAFVEYRVGVDVAMPRLRVDVNRPTKYSEPLVHYECEHPRSIPPGGRTKACNNWQGFVSVKSELLLPEADRPSGFRQKTKALFGGANIPTYAFDWVCVAPQHLYLGQPVSFRVCIKPREQQQQQSTTTKTTTNLIIPEIHLKSLHLEIVAHTLVRAERSLFTCPESEGNYTVCQISGTSANNSGGGAGEPFSKANGYTKIVNTPVLLPGNTGMGMGGMSTGTLSSTFTTYNIAVQYTATVRLAFLIVDKVKKFETEYGVVVYPPVEHGKAPAPAQAHSPAPPPFAPQWGATAGPSSAPPDIGGMAEEPLPAYEETPSNNRK